MSTHIIYKENLQICKLLHDKACKKRWNFCSEGPFIPFPPWIYICFSIQQSLVTIIRMFVLIHHKKQLQNFSAFISEHLTNLSMNSKEHWFEINCLYTDLLYPVLKTSYNLLGTFNDWINFLMTLNQYMYFLLLSTKGHWITPLYLKIHFLHIFFV